jgi:hypothetical protein
MTSTLILGLAVVAICFYAGLVLKEAIKSATRK